MQRLVHSVRKCIIRPRMDTISHGIAGSVFARSFAERPGARAAFVLGAVAAMVPDLDFVFFSTRLDYLRDHRSWTHSFLVLPFLALAIALVGEDLLRAGAPRGRSGSLPRSASRRTSSSTGSRPSARCSGRRSRGRATRSTGCSSSIPSFTGIVVATPRALASSSAARQRRIAAVGAGLLCAYIGLLRASLHARALAIWKQHGRAARRRAVAVLPQFLSPFRWLGLSESGNEVHVAFFDIGPFASGVADPKPPEEVDRDRLRACRTSIRRPDRATIQRFEQAARLAGPRGGARACRRSAST